MKTIFNSPILTLLQSGPKTPEQQVQRATSPLQQSVSGRQRISLPDFTSRPLQIKPIIPARDATGTVQSVQHNTHTDQVPTNIDERLKRNRQILGDVVETAIDLTPIVGDIKGLTWDPIKAGIEGGFGAGLSMAGLGLIGLVPGVGDITKKAGKTIIKNADHIVKPLYSDIDKKLEHYWPKPLEKPKPVRSISIKQELERFKDEDVVKKGIPYVTDNEIEYVINPKRIFTNEVGNMQFNAQNLLNNIFIDYYKQNKILTEEQAEKLANDILHNVKLFRGDFSQIKNPPVGFFNPDMDVIAIDNRLKKILGVILHEEGHYLDKLGYWNKGNDSAKKFRLLEDAYQVIPNNTDKSNIGARKLEEKYATNVKLKYPFAWNFFQRYKEMPKSDQIAQFIHETSNEDVLKNINNMLYQDGYIHNYYEFLKKYPEQIPILKSALSEIYTKGGKINEDNTNRNQR